MDAEWWMTDEKDADEKDDFQPLSKEDFAKLATNEKASYLARAKRHLQQEIDALNSSIDRRRAHMPVEAERRGGPEHPGP